MFLLPVARRSPGHFLHMPLESLCLVLGWADVAAHGHMPASGGVIPVPGAQCCPGELQEQPPHIPWGGHARSSPGAALQLPLLNLLSFALCFLLETQNFSHLGGSRSAKVMQAVRVATVSPWCCWCSPWALLWVLLAAVGLKP